MKWRYSRKLRIIICGIAGAAIIVGTILAQPRGGAGRVDADEHQRIESRIETMKDQSIDYRVATETRLAKIEAELIRTREILGRFETMLYGAMTALGLLVFETVLGLLGIRRNAGGQWQRREEDHANHNG